MNKKMQELIKLRKELLSNKKNVESGNQKNAVAGNVVGKEAGKVKKLSLGELHEKLYESPMKENNLYHGEKGFSSAFMLGFLVFIFEITFLIISYFIFK